MDTAAEAGVDDVAVVGVDGETSEAFAFRQTVDGVAENPGSVVVDGDAVWVGDWSAPQVTRLSAVGPPRIRPIRLPGGTAGVWNIAVGGPAIWAVTPDDDAVWRIDATSSAVSRVNLPYRPTGVTADATNVWVTVRGR